MDIDISTTKEKDNKLKGREQELRCGFVEGVSNGSNPKEVGSRTVFIPEG